MSERSLEATQVNAAKGAVLQDSDTLARLPRRTVKLAAILLPAAVVTVLLVVSQSRATRVADVADRAIPAFISVGDRTWTSSPMTFSDEEMDILETRDYLYRTYSDGRGTPVDLCVIFSEDNRKGTHPPEVCLEGSGGRIVMRGDRAEDVAGMLLTMRELVITAPGGEYEYFAYFYKCGDVFTPSFYKQQVQIVWNGLTRQNASGALIRYSTHMGPRGAAQDVEAARQRVAALLAVTFPHIRDGLNPTAPAPPSPSR